MGTRAGSTEKTVTTKKTPVMDIGRISMKLEEKPVW
jgi:hypothetical protein